MIYDLVKANHHSSDPEWDGEPLEEFYAEPIDLYGFQPPTQLGTTTANIIADTIITTHSFDTPTL